MNQKSVIIMDEVDGMSAGDRGGVGALNALIKKTKVPIIAICNDKSSPKMKPLAHTCFQMIFKRYVSVRPGAGVGADRRCLLLQAERE